MKRINLLDPGITLDGENAIADAWVALEHSSPAQATYEGSLTKQMAEIGCSADAAPYVILGLLDDLHRLDGPHGAELADKFLDKANCAGAQGLPDDAKAKLRTIREAAMQGSAAGIPASSHQPDGMSR